MGLWSGCLVISDDVVIIVVIILSFVHVSKHDLVGVILMGDTFTS
jgi:hypothetical protein